jgi:hypothetical protein
VQRYYSTPKAGPSLLYAFADVVRDVPIEEPGEALERQQRPDDMLTTPTDLEASPLELFPNHAVELSVEAHYVQELYE